MDNPLELTLLKIDLSGINIIVMNRTNTEVLSKKIVIVKKLNLDTLNFDDANYEMKNDATEKEATIVATDRGEYTDFSQDDLLIVQIIDTDGKTSDRISLNFKQQYILKNSATTKYEMPEEPGNYKLKLLSINDVDLNDPIETEEFNLCAPPGSDSKIIVNKNYLTRFGGQICLVTNVLTQVKPSGNYQIVFSANKQSD